MAELILVTGATGTLGSEVLKQLVAQGTSVRAAVRSQVRAAGIDRSRVEVVEVDTTNLDSMTAACTGVSKLFLLPPLIEDMVTLANRWVDAARKAGVQTIVKQSILGCAREPGIMLGRWHRSTEKYIQALGFSWTFLRPNSFFQNYISSSGQTIRLQNAFYLPLADSMVSLVDARDVAAVAVKALTTADHQGQAYTITGPSAISNYEIASIFTRQLGRPIEYNPLSEKDARHALQRSGGMPDWLSSAVLKLYAMQRYGEASEVTPVVREVTGQAPRSFETFVRDHLDAFK